jgi:hypothetical protein
MDMDELITLLGIVIVFGVLGVAVVDEFNQRSTERYCLSKGYPQGDWRWFGPNYCIKRVDQTDVVVSTDSLR